MSDYNSDPRPCQLLLLLRETKEAFLGVNEELEDAIKVALQKASNHVEKIDDRYQVGAFPVVLRYLLTGAVPSNSNSGNAKFVSTENNQEQRLPSNLIFGEFIQKINPKTHVNRFLCIGYYLCHSGKTVEFNVANILDLYTKIRWSKPKNPSDILGTCVEKFYLTEGPNSAPKTRTWGITPTGETYVEELMVDNSK